MLTSQDLFFAARARLLALTDRYSAAAIDKEGNDINIILRIMAGVGEELSLESSGQDLARALATVASTTDEQVERLCSDITGGQVRRFGDAAAIEATKIQDPAERVAALAALGVSEADAPF